MDLVEPRHHHPEPGPPGLAPRHQDPVGVLQLAVFLAAAHPPLEPDPRVARQEGDGAERDVAQGDGADFGERGVEHPKGPVGLVRGAGLVTGRRGSYPVDRAGCRPPLPDDAPLTATDAPMQAKLWCLLGRKAGDNAQVLALAEALGWPRADKHIVPQPWEIVPHLLMGPTLAGIDRGASSPLGPPWPDLVITAGRRNEPVARWIRAQAGGGVRLVHVGRPWARPGTFDLVVSTPQYFLPEGPGVLVNPLPLHRITRESVEAAAKDYAPRVAHLPRPLTTVLIGGDSGPVVFTPEKGRRLAHGINGLVRQTGGAALVTGSPRTPTATAQAVRAALDVPAETHFRHDGGDENPYLGFLGLADRFVVTGESMSMLAEAGSLGRPPGKNAARHLAHPVGARGPRARALARRGAGADRGGRGLGRHRAGGSVRGCTARRRPRARAPALALAPSQERSDDGWRAWQTVGRRTRAGWASSGPLG